MDAFHKQPEKYYAFGNTTHVFFFTSEAVSQDSQESVCVAIVAMN